MTEPAPTFPDVAGLRVLAFCDYYGPGNGGGSERVAREVNQRLAQRGAEVTVCTASNTETFDDPSVAVERIRAHDLSARIGAQLAIAPRYYRSARTVARRCRPQVLVTHSLHFHGSLVATRLSRRLGIPLVTVAHVGGVERLRGSSRVLAEGHERTLGRWILRSSTRVVAVSRAVADHCRARGARPNDVMVVPNGVDHERFVPSDPPEDLGPTVMFIGRLIGNKGPDLLLDACRQLWSAGSEARVVFVGDGPMRHELERQATSSSGGRATVVGAVDDVAHWLRRTHVVARPSYTEGMPLTLLEAMAAKRVVVASDIPANREVIVPGKTGLLHRVGDAADLAEKLSCVLGDRALRERLADGALAASQPFTWEATAMGHANVLLSAVGEQGR